MQIKPRQLPIIEEDDKFKRTTNGANIGSLSPSVPTSKLSPMAATRNFLATSVSTASKFTPPAFSTLSFQSFPKHRREANLHSARPLTAKAASVTGENQRPLNDERVIKIHNAEEFDEALINANKKLLVVEFASSLSVNSHKIYPFMVELSRTCNDVVFLLVMGDESKKTKALCERENVQNVPHFIFYKSMEKIHEEAAIGPDQLENDVLYYGDNHSAVVQLHSKEDVQNLINLHKEDRKLIVIDVGLKHCGPCVKVYPTVVKLSKKMSDIVVFARMNGDENESCMSFLKEMNVVEVPTFLFIRDGYLAGTYVGSGKSELVGEILRYQGVKVT